MGKGTVECELKQKAEHGSYSYKFYVSNEKFEYCYPHSNVLFNYMHCFSRNMSQNEQQITMALTNHKGRCSRRWGSDGISQNILSQIFEDIQSDVALQCQVHLIFFFSERIHSHYFLFKKSKLSVID